MIDKIDEDTMKGLAFLMLGSKNRIDVIMVRKFEELLPILGVGGTKDYRCHFYQTTSGTFIVKPWI